MRDSVRTIKAYAGIGSRETPQDILDLMFLIGDKLARKGWLLRSGGAKGADTAFEKGCDVGRGQKEIFLPRDCQPWCIRKVGQYMPEDRPPIQNMKPYIQNLLGRNMQQLFGRTGYQHVLFVVCWTSDGKDSGGTGYAIRAANDRKIKVFNLFCQETRDQIEQNLLELS